MGITVLQPSSIDSWMYAYDPNVKFGTTTELWIGAYGDAYPATTLVKWDMSSLSGSNICDSATLSLWLKNDYASASVVWKVYRVKRNWTETGVTWNQYAAGSSWQTAGALGKNDIDLTEIGTSGSISPTTPVGTEIQISLSPTEVQKMYDGTYTNYGFIVKAANTGVVRWYCHSRSSTTTAYRPKLTINSHLYDPTPFGTYDQYTKSLLHFDTSSDIYYFRDELQNIWTPYRYPSTSGSGPYISTTEKKFGTGSGYFAGSAVGDWIETPTQFNFGSQDWTCDFWIRPNFDGIETSWTHRGLFGYDVDDYNFWSCEISGSATDNQRFRYIERLSGSLVYAAIGSIMPLQEDVWQHVAFVKQGTNLKGYLSGTNYMNTTIGSSMPSFMNQIFKIGNVGTASMYRGYMDEFRLSIGIARWTSNFTPPDRAYAPVTAPRGQPFMYSSYPWI